MEEMKEQISIFICVDAELQWTSSLKVQIAKKQHHGDIKRMF